MLFYVKRDFLVATPLIIWVNTRLLGVMCCFDITHKHLYIYVAYLQNYGRCCQNFHKHGRKLQALEIEETYALLNEIYRATYFF